MFHILVTDTNSHIITLLKRELEREGYRVSCLKRGTEIYHIMVTGGGYDLIILDPELLEPYGYSVLEKALSCCTDVPIILHSFNVQSPEIPKQKNIITIKKSDPSITELKKAVKGFSFHKQAQLHD